MGMKPNCVSITVMILTYNEERNIGECIESLKRAAEVIIIDSGSTDGTRERALQVRPDARILVNKFEDFGQQRNWALDHANPAHPWVLFVDADEFCTEQLFDEIEGFIQTPGTDVGAYIAGRNYFLGRWLKYSTMYPSYQFRLLRTGTARFEKAGHGQREVTDGAIRYLKQGWRHENFSKGVEDWISRHNRYSTAEVELIARLRGEPLQFREFFSPDRIKRRRAIRLLSTRLPFTPILMFIYTYIIRLGFLDGRAGLIYCSLLMAHQIHVITKISERESSQQRLR